MEQVTRIRLPTFTVLALSVVSFVLLQSLAVPVLSETQRYYETTQRTTTWVLTGYLLSASICTPLLGRLGDALGKRLMLIVTLSILTAGSTMAALAPSIEWLIIARVVQGVGGGVLPLSFGIARDNFGRHTTAAISMLSSLTAVGVAAGIVIAGPIVETLGYPWLYWLPAITTAVAALAAARFIPEAGARTPSRLPLVPALLLTVWLIALLLGLSEGNEWGWRSTPVLALFGVALLVAVAWARIESRVAVPLIDMRMMRRRGVWTANVVALFVGFGTFSSFGFLPQLLQTPDSAGYGLGATVSEAGRLMLPSAAASFLMGFVSARLGRALGTGPLVCTGLLLTAGAFASIALWHDATWQICVANAAQGLGSGAVFAGIASVVVSSVPAAQTGTASGMNANIRTIGGSIGAAVLAGLVTSDLDALGIPAERGYTIGFLVLSAGMVVAASVALAIPNVHRTTHAAPLADATNAELGLVPAAPASSEPPSSEPPSSESPRPGSVSTPR